MDEIDLTDGNTKGRHVQPQGFVPSHLAEPMLRDRDARSTALEYVATTLGEVRGVADILASPVEDGEDPALRTRLAAFVSTEVGRAQRLVKALAVGALALLIVGGVTLTGGGRAEAMEAPQPDPVAAQMVRVVAPASVSVVLGSSSVTTRIRVTTPHVTPRGYHCASAWSPVSFLGRACSRYATFTVPVTLGVFTPLGRSVLAVTDDVAPMDTAPARVALDVRRLSRFGVGAWTPTQYGDGLTVSATLFAYTPALGRWTPQQASPVKVQELRAGRWLTVGAGTTNRYGMFLVTVIVGGGPHTLRVHRDTGATVGPVNGTPRPFYLYPTDVPDGIV